MSGAALAWAWKQPVPMSAAKFVLVALADQTVTDLGFMAVSTLAKATGLDRKTVMTSIARLIEWRFIEDTGERRGRTGSVPVYRLLMNEGLFDNAPFPSSPKNGTSTKIGTASEAVPKTDSSSTNFPAKQSQKRDTDPELTQELDPSLSARARATECAKAIIAAGFPAVRMNPSHPELLRVAEVCTPNELADVVTEVTARGGAPPSLAYVCTIAINRRRDAAAREVPDETHRSASQPRRRESLADRAAARARAIFAGSAEGCREEGSPAEPGSAQ